MARIRTIKPEFWADEKLGPLDPLTRLVFLGLVSMADDLGRLVDSVRQIDAMLFSYTEDSSREALANLSRMGRIKRGESASGQKIIQIVNWHHQRVDHPNMKAALPRIAKELTEDSRGIREAFASDSRGIRDSINDQRPVPATNKELTNNPSSSARAVESESAIEAGLGPIATLLESDADREALADLLDQVPSPRTWYADMAASLDAMPGHHPVTPRQLGCAIRDFLGNGAAKAPKLAVFRRYLERAGKPDTPPSTDRAKPARRSKQQVGQENLTHAIERRARERADRGEPPQDGDAEILERRRHGH